VPSGFVGRPFLDRPAVAVGVAEEHEGVPAAAGAVDAVGALVVLDLADLDTSLEQLGPGGLDVGDDQLQSLVSWSTANPTCSL
jgi:hypothetical protein